MKWCKMVCCGHVTQTDIWSKIVLQGGTTTPRWLEEEVNHKQKGVKEVTCRPVQYLLTIGQDKSEKSAPRYQSRD